MAKRALLVGVNRYPDPANNLRGCVNDVVAMSGLLSRGYGFDAARDVRLLTDERATTERIVERLEWLVRGSQAGDVLVFHYSGHGSQIRDRHGDELDDGLDEIICPYDLDWDSPFTDDDLGRALEPAAEGAHLVVVLDCCHSGTGLRGMLPPTAPERPRYIQPPIDILHRVAHRVGEGGTGRRHTPTGALPEEEWPPRRFGASATERGAILIAGCRADQTSADAWIDGDYHGALTFFLCQVLEQHRYAVSYQRLVGDVRRLLRQQHYEQVPQLECAKTLTDELVFSPLGAPVGTRER